MNFLVRLVISALAVFVTAKILPGVHVDSMLTAILVALVLALLNVVVKPVLVFLTIPVTIITFGLFLLVINAIMILMVSNVVDGFTVSGFWTALLFSIILSIITSLLSAMGKMINRYLEVLCIDFSLNLYLQITNRVIPVVIT